MLLAEGLRHRFGAVRALDDISFAVEPGRKDFQNFAARENRWLAKLLVEADRERVLGRAGAALRQVPACAELSLRCELPVYESRKLLGR